jgi:hypothetical protein
MDWPQRLSRLTRGRGAWGLRGEAQHQSIDEALCALVVCEEYF